MGAPLSRSLVDRFADRKFRRRVVDELMKTERPDLIADRKKMVARLKSEDVQQALLTGDPTDARKAFPGVSEDDAAWFVAEVAGAIISVAVVHDEKLRPLLIQGLQSQSDRDDLKDGQAAIYHVVTRILERIGPQSQGLDRIYGSPPLPYGKFDPSLRADMEAALDQQISESDRPLAVVAVNGLGGIGKTQLVRHWWDTVFARSHFDHGLWLDLAQDDLAEQLRPLAQRVAGDDVEPLDAVKHLLRNTTASWLVVLDNMADSRHAERFLVSNPQGSVRFVITSRHTTGWDSVNAIALPMTLLDEPQAAKLLRDVAQRPHDPGAEKLAERLGYLPVLLTLAANVVREDSDERFGFDEYRRDHETGLPDLTPHDQAGYNKAIESLWTESLAIVESRQGGSTTAFQLMSIIDWSNIDYDWFIARAQQMIPQLADGRSANKAVGLLRDFGLIVIDDDRIAISHNTLADGAGATPSPESRRLALAILQLPTHDALFAHQRHLVVSRAAHLTAEAYESALVLARRQCETSLADVPMHVALVTGASDLLDPDSDDLLTLRSYLGTSYRQAGRTNDAITTGEQVLTDRVRILGPEHPDTLTTKANLALTYYQAGRTNDAIRSSVTCSPLPTTCSAPITPSFWRCERTTRNGDRTGCEPLTGNSERDRHCRSLQSALVPVDVGRVLGNRGSPTRTKRSTRHA